MMRLSILMSLVVLSLGSLSFAAEETLDYGRFGKLTLYRETSQPNHVVLFISGDGGWNLGVIDMAKSLAGLDALVIGIDITHYLGELARSADKCSYPASDFEFLSKYIQYAGSLEYIKWKRFPDYAVYSLFYKKVSKI